MLFRTGGRRRKDNGFRGRGLGEPKGRQLLDTFSEPDVKTKYAKLDEMFLNDVDLDYVGKFVVGKYWRQMTPEQRERYIPLFKRYSLSLYKNFPLSFDFKINFKITGVKLDRDYADVTADISLDGRQQPGQPAEKVSGRLSHS